MTAAQPDLAQDTNIQSRISRRERVKVSQDISAGLAHELRNPVFAIASAAQLLRYRITDDPVIEKNIGRIMREVERLNALVTALLEYGRPAPVQLAPGDPDGIWVDVIASHRGDLEAKAVLAQHTPATPRAVCNIDPGQFAQALSSVLSNAIEAAPEGSDVAIVSSTQADGAWRCTVHNDGPPVSAYILPRVFEPLVSSKPGHPGTGLAIAHRIMCDHSGTIALDSADGGGTTLTFKVPAVHG